jgi:hypothetical protein
MFYAEGKWDHHLDDFASCPSGAFCSTWTRATFSRAPEAASQVRLSGGIPNTLLSYGKPDEVRAHVRRRSSTAWRATAGTSWTPARSCRTTPAVENLRALTEAAREYGVYSATPSDSSVVGAISTPHDGSDISGLKALEGWPPSAVPPGVCFPWETKVQELPEISGDKELLRRIWQNIDSLGNTYIWQCLLSF